MKRNLLTKTNLTYLMGLTDLTNMCPTVTFIKQILKKLWLTFSIKMLLYEIILNYLKFTDFLNKKPFLESAGSNVLYIPFFDWLWSKNIVIFL